MPTSLSCLGALALELSPGTLAARMVLDQAAAGELAALIARDLNQFTAASELDLAVLAGLFDPVELLRPGWPLYAEIERWAAQAPGGGSRVIAFGASDGQLLNSLRPRADYAGGALRLLPWLLRGDPANIAIIGARLESVLLDQGMAGADTALLAQEAFGATIEHARYLTLHDLAALTAMQYEHAGLGSVWPLIEAALLSPNHEQWLDAPPEPLARFSDGQVRIALLDPDAWARAEPASADKDDARSMRLFERFQLRQRQIAALLEAHGIPVVFDHCPSGKDPKAILFE